MTSQEDDVLLVLRVQSGDTAAFEKLLRRLHAPLRKYVRSLAGELSVDEVASSNLEFSSSKADLARYPSSGYAQVPDTLSHEEQHGRL